MKQRAWEIDRETKVKKKGEVFVYTSVAWEKLCPGQKSTSKNHKHRAREDDIGYAIPWYRISDNC